MPYEDRTPTTQVQGLSLFLSVVKSASKRTGRAFWDIPTGAEEAGDQGVFLKMRRCPSSSAEPQVREAKMADSTRQVFGNRLLLRLSKGALWDLHTQVAWEQQGNGGTEMG